MALERLRERKRSPDQLVHDVEAGVRELPSAANRLERLPHRSLANPRRVAKRVDIQIAERHEVEPAIDRQPVAQLSFQLLILVCSGL